jgi:hypothetical protein
MGEIGTQQKQNKGGQGDFHPQIAAEIGGKIKPLPVRSASL